VADNDPRGGFVSRGNRQNIKIGATDTTSFKLNQDIGGLLQAGDRPLFIVKPAFPLKNRNIH
jgi:hypothetical protein